MPNNVNLALLNIVMNVEIQKFLLKFVLNVKQVMLKDLILYHV